MHHLINIPQIASVGLFFVRFSLDPSLKIRIKDFVGFDILDELESKDIKFIDYNCYGESITIQSLLEELSKNMYPREEYYYKKITISRNNLLALLLNMIEVIDENEKDYKEIKKLKKFIFNPRILYLLS